MSMIPKDSSFLPFAWSKDAHQAFDEDTRKLLQADLEQFSNFCSRMTLYHEAIKEPLRWTRTEMQWAFMTLQTRFELSFETVGTIRIDYQVLF